MSLAVVNAGQTTGQATATVVGMQNGVKVYEQTVMVSDPLSRGSTAFRFPSYVSTAAGAIRWTVTITDGNSDTDRVSVTTLVVDSAGDEHDEEHD